MLGQKEWRFNCPQCGKGERLIQQVVDDDRAMGRIDVEEGAISIQELPVKSNTKNYGVGDEISVLLVYQDICVGCGVIYIFKMVRDIKKMRKNVSDLVLPQGPGIPRIDSKN
jgi:hypothetical protein